MTPGGSLAARGPLTLAATVAALCILISVTYRIYDPDLWQHLAVGRAIWQTHGLPRTNVWTWPSYGEPAVLWSWGFRALLWPFWAAGGVAGMFVWRWLTTLAAFALVWLAARRMGVLRSVGLVVFVVCGLIYRQRSMPRPETLAAVLFALEILILETRRHGGRDLCGWLVLALWLWVQVHVSFVWGFAVLGIYLIHDLLPAPATGGPGRARSRAARRAPTVPAAPVAPRPSARRLAGVGALALVAAFVNPFHVGLLLQPLDFFLHQRNEAIFRSIDELKSIEWSLNTRNGLPLLLVGWPVLALWRPGRRAGDRVELMLMVVFTVLVVSAQRFIGVYALVAAPFVARDLEAWAYSRAVRTRPRSTDAPPDAGEPDAPPETWRAAILVAATCVVICVPEWLRIEPRIGLGLDLRTYPVAACDFIAAHGVRGRGFNYFNHGGYMLWRFWPDRGRLPFIDIHQTGTPELHDAYMRAVAGGEGLRAADARYHFDYLLLRREQLSEDHILDAADGDSAWAPVFIDDAAALYVRRAGPLAAVADSFAYRHACAGPAHLARLGAACATDSSLRMKVGAELLREVRESPRNALAYSLLANIALIEGRWEDARRELESALALAPGTPLAHERLGMIAGALGKPEEALREFQQERRLHPERLGVDYLIGKAYRERGDLRQAERAYQRELARNPGHADARDSLAAIRGMR